MDGVSRNFGGIIRLNKFIIISTINQTYMWQFYQEHEEAIITTIVSYLLGLISGFFTERKAKKAAQKQAFEAEKRHKEAVQKSNDLEELLQKSREENNAALEKSEQDHVVFKEILLSRTDLDVEFKDIHEHFKNLLLNGTPQQAQNYLDGKSHILKHNQFQLYLQSEIFLFIGEQDKALEILSSIARNPNVNVIGTDILYDILIKRAGIFSNYLSKVEALYESQYLAYRIKPSDELAMDIVQTLILAKQMPQANRWLNLISDENKTLKFYELKFQTLMSSRLFQEAREVLSTILKKSPNSSYHKSYEVTLLINMGKLDEAENVAKRIYLEYPNEKIALEIYIEVLYKKKDPSGLDMMNIFRKKHGLDLNTLPIQLQLWFDAFNYVDIVNTCKKFPLLRNLDVSGTSLSILAEACMRLGKNDLAIFYYNVLLSKWPDDIYYHERLCVIYVQDIEKNEDKIYWHLNHIDKIEPSNYQSNIFEAMVLIYFSDFTKAFKLIDNVLKFHPDFPNALLLKRKAEKYKDIFNARGLKHLQKLINEKEFKLENFSFKR